jgi:hypothetical protein
MKKLRRMPRQNQQKIFIRQIGQEKTPLSTLMTIYENFQANWPHIYQLYTDD